MQTLLDRIRTVLTRAGIPEVHGASGGPNGPIPVYQAGYQVWGVNGHTAWAARFHVYYLQPPTEGATITQQFPRQVAPMLQQALGKGVTVEFATARNLPALLVTDLSLARREDFWNEVAGALRAERVPESRAPSDPASGYTTGFQLHWCDDNTAIQVRYHEGLDVFPSGKAQAKLRANFEQRTEPTLKSKFGRRRVTRNNDGSLTVKFK